MARALWFEDIEPQQMHAFRCAAIEAFERFTDAWRSPDEIAVFRTRYHVGVFADRYPKVETMETTGCVL